MRNLTIFLLTVIFSIFFVNPELGFGQGITTANLSGTITDSEGNPLSGANVVATHEPTGIQYGAAVRDGGQYDILSMRIGGPYTIRVTFIGYGEQSESDVYLQLGQTSNVDFQLTQEAIQGAGVLVTAEMHDVLNSGRTGAASYISSDQVEQMPSVNRSIRDLIRLDPRSDGNYSFGGRNWLYNSISLDGSYFNNPFGLDDPAPGGQAGAEPVSFDAIEQVQVSIAPFDVREGGFTGAGINTVTKSGTNQFHGSVYDYTRNQSMIGNSVGDVDKVIEDPNLKFNQVGFTFSGPIIQNKLFFFVNAEVERRTDPGTNYSASSGAAGAGESRVDAATMQAIRDRMLAVYGYDTGPFQGYDQKTDNNKALLKLDWNVSSNHNATFRVNILDARRDLGPHPFVLSFNSTGRGPNTSSLPFQNSGYQINNDLQSYAFELNSTFGGRAANRFFFSYNRFRDFRDPLSADFPTIDIGQDGVTYTTLGHEPFSIHNILDQNVLQITDNYSYFSGNHIYTVGASYEKFSFFNSFNIFRHGVFFLPDFLDFIGGATFSSVDDFLRRTGADPDSADFVDFKAMIGSGPFKGEQIDVAQFSVYAQDEYQMSEKLKLTYGLRVDIPVYLTEPEANPFSIGLTLLDENDKTEVVDQAKLPGSNPLYSPRIGFNYDVNNDRSLQIRGGTGVFTGRVPFVWIGNVISNPGNNPNLYSPFGGDVGAGENITDDGSSREGNLKNTTSVLQQSFDVNAMVDDFKWPQVWTTNFAVDKQLARNWLGTFELVYGKDLNAIFMRNADLGLPVRTLKDGRPYYGGIGNNELNSFFPGSGEGVYVIDNISEGFNLTLTGQLRKKFDNGLSTGLAYTYLKAENNLKSTEIASVLWQNQPVQGDPNNPQLGASEFGNPHRIIANMNYLKSWSERQSTSFGVFFERTQGNRFLASGGNRYSFIYSGDVNGDGYGGNDLIYIPTDANDIVLADAGDWAALDAFIEQDDYLKEHRGEIAERMGSINPWYTNIDIRVLHNVLLTTGDTKHKIQFSLDILNFANLINSSWGVRQIANPAATSPLALTGFVNGDGEPILDFTGPAETFVDDLSLSSRYQIQVGMRYSF
ncbi:MAG: TonB-dependent receptor [Candidatus Marinimicrobia bacterium]|nr:TonB-dependent receptor [Candidatus Neomarinimicrobiota bacterium]